MEELLAQRAGREAEAYSQLGCASGLRMSPGERDECRAELIQRLRTGPEARDKQNLVLGRLEGREDC